MIPLTSYIKKKEQNLNLEILRTKARISLYESKKRKKEEYNKENKNDNGNKVCRDT